MKTKIKPLQEQVMIITGATSGIGLVTARMAAKQGSRLVLVARDEKSLQQLVDEIEGQGGQAIFVAADVADEEQVRNVAREAIRRFGGFDTWVNNAGMAIYGQMLDIRQEDHRRLFDVNFWGIVYGSLEAARHFRERGGDSTGVIINLGSVVSDRALPVQGMYSVTKHAVKGFTDALRLELEHEGVNVALSLVKPAAIATPFPQHARNYMKEAPSLPPPVYAPDLVANAILHCAQTAQRDVFVGGAGKMMSLLGTYLPGLGDVVFLRTIFKPQKEQPRPDRLQSDSLYTPGFGLHERGDIDRSVVESSIYTDLITSPVAKAALVLGLISATLAWISASEKK